MRCFVYVLRDDCVKLSSQPQSIACGNLGLVVVACLNEVREYFVVVIAFSEIRSFFANERMICLRSHRMTSSL